MAEKYEWEDKFKDANHIKEGKKYSWEDKFKDFDYGRGDQGFDYGRSQNKECTEDKTLDEEIADVFVLATETLINHNKNKLIITQEAIQELDATDQLAQHFQDRINDLTAHIEKLTADCEEVKANPTQETVNRVRARC